MRVSRRNANVVVPTRILEVWVVDDGYYGLVRVIRVAKVVDREGKFIEKWSLVYTFGDLLTDTQCSDTTFAGSHPVSYVNRFKWYRLL